MARHRLPPEPEAPDPSTVPPHVAAGPVGDDLLQALLDYAVARERWRVAAGLSREDVNRMVRSRAPRTPSRGGSAPQIG